jgi:hypothetical protein
MNEVALDVALIVTGLLTAWYGYTHAVADNEETESEDT